MATKGSRATPEWLQSGTKGPTLTERMMDELDRTYAGLRKAQRNYERGDETAIAKLQGRIHGIAWCIATVKNPFNVQHAKDEITTDMQLRYKERKAEAVKRGVKK